MILFPSFFYSRLSSPVTQVACACRQPSRKLTGAALGPWLDREWLGGGRGCIGNSNGRESAVARKSGDGVYKDRVKRSCKRSKEKKIYIRLMMSLLEGDSEIRMLYSEQQGRKWVDLAAR